MEPDKSQKQERGDRWGKDEGRNSSFCITDGHMSFKNADLEAKHQKYKGPVVLRDDTVKDYSGTYAVFTEQGSPASQMTTAEVMDMIYRLPGCAQIIY